MTAKQMSAWILAVANQKDRVGKTTTTVNLAASLASKSRRILVVDLDPQDNATIGSGIGEVTIENDAYQIVLGGTDIPNAVVRSREGGYDILGVNRALAGAEVELVQEIACEVRLKNALQPVADNYDYILIDCPPSLALLTLNGLVAANGVTVSVLCKYYALEGISDPVTTVRKIHQAINPDLDVTGIICTMYDSRSRLVVEVNEQLKQHFDNLLFDTVIPRNIRLAGVPSHGLPAFTYNTHAKGTQAYLDLADELIARLKK